MAQPHPVGAMPPEPVFQVRLIKHTGAALLWFNQRYTVTGSLAQCQAAVREAQHHNLAAGWWSIGSLLLWNWIALSTNRSARQALVGQATEVYSHPYWVARVNSGQMPSMAQALAGISPGRPPVVPPAPPGRARMIAIAALLVAALVTFGAVQLFIRHDPESVSAPAAPTPTPTPTYVSKADLPGLLLTAPEVAAALGIPAITSVTEPGHANQPWGDEVVDNDCVSLRFVPTNTFYANSGWTALRKDFLQTPVEGAVDNTADQAVVAFGNAEAAKAFYDHALGVWKNCANRTINTRQVKVDGSVDEIWSVGPVSDSGELLAIALLQQDDSDWTCQRALSVRKNIVIDVEACGHATAPATASALVNGIAKKVDAVG